MNPTIYLSCLMLIVGTSADFQSERSQLVNIYGNPGVNEFIKEAKVPLLVNFLERYSHHLDLTPILRLQSDDAVRQYKQEKANEVLVDGVPPQGGGKSKLFKKLFEKIVVPLLIEAGKQGISKAMGSKEKETS